MAPVTTIDLIALLESCGAVLRGHFRLASGRHSDVYVEKFRILERPAVLETAVAAILGNLGGAKPTAVVGPSTGGMIVAYEAARQLGLTATYVELVEGKRTLRRNGHIPPESRVLLVDDVLTTGTSLVETAEVVRAAGATLVGVGVLIDRSEARPDFGCPVVSACRFDARSYAEDDLPDWLAAIPLTTPGTRARMV
jgi:orotate phosphoribosyltransferase